MPLLPKSPCPEPRCPELVEHGSRRCPTHQREWQRQQDARRGSSTQRGYGQEHKRLRILCFERDGWRCVRCGWEPDIVVSFREYDMGAAPTPAILEELRKRFRAGRRYFHADHIQPIDARPDLAKDLLNMQTLCDQCHGSKILQELLRPDRVRLRNTSILTSATGPRVG